MCSTCNHTKYDKITEEVNGRTVERLEHPLGYGSLVIRCDPHGKDYTIGVKNEPKSEVKVYRCITCGRMLF